MFHRSVSLAEKYRIKEPEDSKVQGASSQGRQTNELRETRG